MNVSRTFFGRNISANVLDVLLCCDDRPFYLDGGLLQKEKGGFSAQWLSEVSTKTSASTIHIFILGCYILVDYSGAYVAQGVSVFILASHGYE